jgi:3-oxoacyl-[acyl-carrier-protein] synthase-3
MARAVIVGSGIEIPPNRVTNQMLSRIMDTSDEWIRERSGVETRYFADAQAATSDLGVAAARRALEDAGVSKDDVDLVVFATMTPDHYFPGCGGLLQHKLGMRPLPCFDIRQQCAAFPYALQLVDAHVRAGLARTVLLVGAEIHTGFMPWTSTNIEYMYGRSDVAPTPEEFAWNTRFRHLTVLFGDAAAAVVLQAQPGEERGVLDSVLYTDGTDYEKLYVPGTPESKVLHNIHKYGNTTAATIPLLWDEARREGRIRDGDLVLAVAFGAGMNWGATLLRA